MRMGRGEDSTMSNLIVFTVDLIYVVRVINSRKLKCSGHVARMEEGMGALQILTSKATGKRTLRSPRRRWEDNVRMYLNTSNWVDSADRDYWRALVNAALNL